MFQTFSLIKNIPVNLKFAPFLAVFAALFALKNPAAAQLEPVDAPINTNSFYSSLKAAEAVKKLSDFNLKGQVKKITTIEVATKNNLVFEFDNKGVLTKQQNAKEKSQISYNFKDSQLATIISEMPAEGSVNKIYFGTNGFVNKSTSLYISHSDTFYKEAFYQFDENFEQVDIRYKYNIDTSERDVVLEDTYRFSFNAQRQIIKERQMSRHTESSYGSTVNYTYNETTNKLIGFNCVDDCALTSSSNSCANHNVSISYDERGNIKSKSLADYTIRNSTWSNSRAYSFKYNEQNDIIEVYFTDREMRNHYMLPLIVDADKKNNKGSKNMPKVAPTAKPNSVFAYDYDKEGNWISQYEIINGEKKLAKRRTINYY